jgi:hypothetical protein
MMSMQPFRQPYQQTTHATLGYAGAAFLLSAVALSPTALAAPTAPERSIAVCSSDSSAAQVYEHNGQVYISLANLQTNTMPLSNALASTTNSPEQTIYRSTNSDPVAQVSISRQTPNRCTIQIGSNPIEPGTVR